MLFDLKSLLLSSLHSDKGIKFDFEVVEICKEKLAPSVGLCTFRCSNSWLATGSCLLKMFPSSDWWKVELWVMNFKCVYVSDFGKWALLNRLGGRALIYKTLIVWTLFGTACHLVMVAGCYLQGWASSCDKFTDMLLQCCNWVDVWLVIGR